jgi:hypothetical protein
MTYEERQSYLKAIGEAKHLSPFETAELQMYMIIVNLVENDGMPTRKQLHDKLEAKGVKLRRWWRGG